MLEDIEKVLITREELQKVQKNLGKEFQLTTEGKSLF